MRYGSVCSGIGGCAAAWHPLGWETAFFAEIEPFPSAVLKHHYPSVPNAGDFTSIKGDEYGPIELLVGGTPCQSFSVAGLRGGLSDDRGNLALEFLKLAGRTRPRWIVWENVPGVLSSESHTAPDPCAPPPPLDMGRDGQEVETEDEYSAEELHALNCFLAGLSELGYGIAYRILDAQYFGVPQRRRRIFVVGHLGDWRAAAAVLFERHSLQGNLAPSRGEGQRVAPSLAQSSQSSGGIGMSNQELFSQNGEGLIRPDDYPVIAIQGAGQRSIGPNMNGCGISEEEVMYTLNATEQHAVAFAADDYKNMTFEETELARPLTNSPDRTRAAPVVAFAENCRSEIREMDVMPALATGGGKPGVGYPAISKGMAVRRLTPRECERLQGYKDDYTLIQFRGKVAADGPRYKALGNSWAVPVVQWIGNRISVAALL